MTDQSASTDATLSDHAEAVTNDQQEQLPSNEDADVAQRDELTQDGVSSLQDLSSLSDSTPTPTPAFPSSEAAADTNSSSPSLSSASSASPAPPPGPPVSSFSIKRCHLCSRFRRVPSVDGEDSSSPLWTCAQHPDVTVASCDGIDDPPIVTQPAKLVHYRSLPANPPYNFTLLGILPFDDVFYTHHYAHPGWTKHETLWLLQRLREEGPEHIESISRDPLLFHHQRDGCEARFCHLLTLAALYQQSISTLTMPFNPYIQHMQVEQPALQVTIAQSAHADHLSSTQSQQSTSPAAPMTYAEKVQQRQLELTRNKQKKISANAAKRKRERARDTEERYDRRTGVDVAGTRSSGRFAGQKRKTYANLDSDDEDIDDEDDEEDGAEGGDGRRWKPQEIEYLWKIEKILTERRRIVKLDAQGQPILEEESSSSSSDESDNEKEEDEQKQQQPAAESHNAVEQRQQQDEQKEPTYTKEEKAELQVHEDDDGTECAPLKAKGDEKELEQKEEEKQEISLIVLSAPSSSASSSPVPALVPLVFPVSESSSSSAAAPSTTSTSTSESMADVGSEVKNGVAIQEEKIEETEPIDATMVPEDTTTSSASSADAAPATVPSLASRTSSIASAASASSSSDHKHHHHHHHRHRHGGDATSSSAVSSSDAPLHSPRKIRLHREHSTESALPSDPTSLTLTDPNTTIITEYLVKIENQSYLHVEWHTRDSLIKKFGERNTVERLSRYNKSRLTQDAMNLDRYGGEPFDPRFVLVDRVIASDIITLEDENLPTPTTTITTTNADGTTTTTTAPRVVPESERKIEMFFVKWSGLSYSQCTWETAEDIADELKIAQFRRFNRPPSTLSTPQTPLYTPEEFQRRKDHWYTDSPVYKGKNQLRDYQVTGLNWLIKAWYDDRNGILADEMGLGKTVQCVSLFEHLRRVEYIQGPFLVIVPLGTISHWKKEVENWTDMNVVIYHDVVKGRDTRDIIREYEFYYATSKRIKFHILVTTYEILMADIDVLVTIPWRHMTIDEGHRLKNKSSKILETLKLLKCNRRLLLTGTPIQNNTSELWTLLNFLEPDLFASAIKFEEKFGHLLESDQVTALQNRIRPFVLRRMKEAVEKSIPPKEETIIDIELTTIQKKYYRAIYEKNLLFLRAGLTKSNMPRLVNVEMELRKACNHPFLIAGAEDKELPPYCTDEQYMAILIAASGKMVLLDKLLPKMKAEGHRVLIFSQFVSVLDIVEEYCNWKGYAYERLDGGVRGNEREAAIDRFTKPNSNRFLFLLSTRAGGVGLNLAAADTVIIFDSDWNPQQDMQAQARAHRIGQKNKVMIYRLVTRNTYESQMFVKASKKLGLDHAVLTNLELGREADIGTEDDRASIDKILRLGAYGLFDESGDAASKEFEESAIEEILQKHAHVVTFNKGAESKEEQDQQIDGETGAEQQDTSSSPHPPDDSTGTTSSSHAADASSSSSGAAAQFRLNYHKMRFSSEKNDLDINDQHFWEKIMGHSALSLTLPPDQLLSQLTDGSAYESAESKQRFVAALTRTVDHILAAKRNGEEPAELDALIGLLIQFQATPAFREDHDRAQRWYEEADQKGERKTRARTREEEERFRSRHHRHRRGGEGEDGEEDDGDVRTSGRTRRHKRRHGDDSDFSMSDGSSGYDDNERRAVENKLGGRVRGKSGAVMNTDLCAICWQSGSLLGCDGTCDRWFHLECLDMSEPPPDDVPWLCDDCDSQHHTCRVCGQRDVDDNVADQGVRCCSVPHCGQFYHLACARKNPYTQWYSDTPFSSFKCPSHYCYRCATPGGDSYYVHCFTCPNALHVKCMGGKDLRIAKKYVFCAECIDGIKSTEKGRACIEASKAHTQQPPVRNKVKLKRPRRGVRNPGARRISQKRWSMMTDEEKEAESKRKAEVKAEARARQKQRRQEKRRLERERRGQGLETESDQTETDTEDEEDADRTDSSSPSSSDSGSSSSSGSESSSDDETESESSRSSSPSDAGSSTETDSDLETMAPARSHFSPGMWRIRFKLDGEVVYQTDKQLMFMATGKRSRRKVSHPDDRKSKKKKKNEKHKHHKHSSSKRSSRSSREKHRHHSKKHKKDKHRSSSSRSKSSSSRSDRSRKRLKTESASSSPLPFDEQKTTTVSAGDELKIRINTDTNEIKRDADGDTMMNAADAPLPQNGVHAITAASVAAAAAAEDDEDTDTDEEDVRSRYPRLPVVVPVSEHKREDNGDVAMSSSSVSSQSTASPASSSSTRASIASARLTGVQKDANDEPVRIRLRLNRDRGIAVQLVVKSETVPVQSENVLPSPQASSEEKPKEATEETTEDRMVVANGTV